MASIQRANSYDLRERVALAPGGLGGLGQAVSRAFIQAGATVIAVDEVDQSARLAALQGELGEAGARLSFMQSDVTDEGAVERLTREVVERHGRLDILVDLVGGFAAGQPVTELSLATWDQQFTLNLRSAFLLAKHAARPMAQQGWGRILLTASRAAVERSPNAAAYAVSKNGVLTLAQTQAAELRESGVTVNAVLPSIIDTPANRAAMPQADTSRWPTPEQIARVLLFLASDDAQLISGAGIPVYGRA